MLYNYVDEYKKGEILDMDKRNATSSWSGYLHQGKVGVFLALRKLNELILDKVDFDDWLIEYESAEDIDVKYLNDVKSRHQVKAYKNGNNLNDYKDVLGILKYEKDENENKKIKDKGFRINDFDDNLNPLELEVDEENRFLHVIEEVKGFGLSEKDFKKNFPRAKYIENPNKIKLYQYPNGNKYCQLDKDYDQIKEFCKDEIKNILNNINHIFKYKVNEYENIFNRIIDNIDQEIRNKHIKDTKKYPQIKLKELCELISNTESYKKSNISELRELFCKSWTIHVQELEVGEIECDILHKDNIEKIIKEIYLFSDEEFVQFLKDINPDENIIGNLDNIDDITKLFKIDNMRDVFFLCLTLVRDEEFLLDKIGYEKDGGYLLTAINRNKIKVKSVIESIINNPNISKNIFDKSYLINGQISNHSFEGILNNKYDTIENNWNLELENSDKFFNPKMKFITVDEAEEKLNKRRI